MAIREFHNFPTIKIGFNVLVELRTAAIESPVAAYLAIAGRCFVQSADSRVVRGSGRA